jgi:hypothetical protein
VQPRRALGAPPPIVGGQTNKNQVLTARLRSGILVLAKGRTAVIVAFIIFITFDIMFCTSLIVMTQEEK